MADQIKEHTKQITEVHTDIVGIKKDLTYLVKGFDEFKSEVRDIRIHMDNAFVTQKEFADVKKEVANIQSTIGWVTKIVVGAVVVALLTLVFKAGLI